MEKKYVANTVEVDVTSLKLKPLLLISVLEYKFYSKTRPYTDSRPKSESVTEGQKDRQLEICSD